MYTTPGKTFIIRDTHRGLWYEDGKLTQILEAGKYEIPQKPWFGEAKTVEVIVVDMRERDLTIKGQEILTADKVAIRVSILVQFKVNDAKAAIHAVEDYQDRLYSDVQLAARRSLASMTLEEILTNRNRLSEDIMQDVAGSAAIYGVEVRRADVKDLIFPGNLQEIMNRVLAAERNSEAQLVEARTQSEVESLKAKTKATALRQQAEAEAEASRLQQEADAQAEKARAELEVAAFEQRQRLGEILQANPALLRLEQIAALRDVAKNANARIYIGLDEMWSEATGGNQSDDE